MWTIFVSLSRKTTAVSKPLQVGKPPTKSIVTVCHGRGGTSKGCGGARIGTAGLTWWQVWQESTYSEMSEYMRGQKNCRVAVATVLVTPG